MMLLHMLVQVGNAGEGISTVLTVGSALVGLLVVDQSSFAAIRVVTSWANMLLAARCLPSSSSSMVVAPVVALCSVPSVHALFALTVRHHSSFPGMMMVAFLPLGIDFPSVSFGSVSYFVIVPLIRLFFVLLVSKLDHLLLHRFGSGGCDLWRGRRGVDEGG